MRRFAVVLGLVVIACGLLSLAVAAVASCLRLPEGESRWAIVGPAHAVEPGSPEDGTVAVRYAPAWLRTDLFLDPGPYPLQERQRMLRLGPADAYRPVPGWVEAIAREHAGPDFSGWQARVAAFGWPRPCLYWIWDWRTESVQGGIVADAGGPGSGGTRKGVPATALARRVIWQNVVFDAVVLGVALVGLRQAWVGVRGLRRWGRGRCRGCGYEVTSVAPGASCPECSAVVRPMPRGVAMTVRLVGIGVAAAVLGLVTSPLVAWTLAALSVAGPGPRTVLTTRVEEAGHGAPLLRLNVHVRRASPVFGGWVLVNVQFAAEPLSSEPARDESSEWDPWALGLIARVPLTTPRADGRGTGWPLVALWHEYDLTSTGAGMAPGGLIIEKIASAALPPAPAAYPRVLPLRPYWPGLLTDAAIYAAIWALVLAGIGMLRQHRRRTRLRTETAAG